MLNILLSSDSSPSDSYYMAMSKGPLTTIYYRPINSFWHGKKRENAACTLYSRIVHIIIFYLCTSDLYIYVCITKLKHTISTCPLSVSSRNNINYTDTFMFITFTNTCGFIDPKRVYTQTQKSIFLDKLKIDLLDLLSAVVNGTVFVSS